MSTEAAALLRSIEANPHDSTPKSMYADWLEENGRYPEAHFLRNHPKQAMIHNGEVIPFRHRYYEFPLHQGDDYNEVAERLDDDGLEGAVEYMSQWEPEDITERSHRYGNPWGSDDDQDTIHLGGSEFTISHNPRMGYIGMTRKVREPVPLPDPSHTEFLEDGGRGPYHEVKAFADSEVGVPHSIAPHPEGGWSVYMAPKEQEPEKFTRLRYARPEGAKPHDLTPLFDALRKNPTAEHIRHELADLLEEQGQPEDAALLRQSIEDKARAIRATASRPGHGNAANLPASDRHHLRTALWSSATDDGEEPLDENHDEHDIDPDTMASMLDDWHRFRAQHRRGPHPYSDHFNLINDDNEDTAAHNFWLSRNGHGAGFLDSDFYTGYGDLPRVNDRSQQEIAKRLQDSARSYGEFHLQAPEPENEEEMPGLDDNNFDDRYADPPPRTITGTSYVNTANDQPERFTRLRYAAAERPARDPAAEERAMLEAIHKNPEAQHITDEYADLLDEWGRPGEAAFHRLPVMEHGYPDHPDAEHLKPTRLNAYPWSKDWHRPQTSFAFIHGVSGIQDRIPMILERIHPSDIGPYGHARHLFTKDMTGAQAKHIMKLLDQQGVPVSPTADGGAGQERYRKQIEDLPDTPQETPVRHSAYRAPKGGTVSRGTYYKGGKLIPDMEGDFMNPPPQQEMPAMQYPPKPQGSLRSRLRAKFSKKEPPAG